MSHGRIDGDHEVERGDNSGRIGEIPQSITGYEDPAKLSEKSGVTIEHVSLERDEPKTGHFHERAEQLQGMDLLDPVVSFARHLIPIVGSPPAPIAGRH